MTAQNLRDRSARPVVTKEERRDELRRRILEIVDRKGSLDDHAIWRESGPDYLPWRPMIEEIKALDKEKKLRLEIIGPGNWMIHSLVTPPAEVSEPTAKSAKRASPTAKKKKQRINQP